jgi:cellulose synthase/poly-beta-1,6-N-acetylglucosamine synthase-like glycosyltransferase
MELLLIFSFLLFIIYASLLLYYRCSWMQINHFQPGRKPAPSTFISILIPARNEEQNLPCLLEALSQQSYPKELFEVMVIDDHSTDGTAGIVKKYAGCKLISLKDFMPAGGINSYKKKAIEVGIQHSRGELIVTTDADCYAEPGWLATIAAFYEKQQPQLIVMPVAINCSNKAIEIFQALDFMTLQGITGASVYKKMHSMCNGANLAYTRQAFSAVNGFSGIDNIASGDDMLLMHKIALQYPNGISFLKSKEVIVQTQPVHTVGQFFNQRIRWASKADKYDDKRIFWVLLLVYLFNVMLLVLPVVAILQSILSTNDHRPWTSLRLWLLLLFLKTITELLFLYPVAKFFNKQSLLLAFPLAQLFHVFYTVIAGWLGKFGSYEWKGRKVK